MTQGFSLPDTPAMQQYATCKAEHADKVILFQMGDFYEMFGDDAILAADILRIQLTSRDKHSVSPVPMCGIPAHSLEKYMYRLLAKGLKVAVCDQLENGSSSKGLVKRGVTRILTPGTVLEDNPENAARNNYICAFDSDKDGSRAAVFCDCSTGEIEVALFNPGEPLSGLFDLLSVFCPKEVLLRKPTESPNDFNRELVRYLTQQPQGSAFSPSIEHPEEYYFDPDANRKNLHRHFKVNSLTAFGLPEQNAVFSAVGVLLHYLQDTQKEIPLHVALPRLIPKAGFMHLDESTLRNLEIFTNALDNTVTHSLFWLLNRTKTGMGARRLRKMIQAPLADAAIIRKRQSAVKELLETPTHHEKLDTVLGILGDTERICAKLALPGFQPRNALYIRNALHGFPLFADMIANFSSDVFQDMQRAFDCVEDACILLDRSLCEELPNKIEEGNVIAPGIDSELDQLRDLKNNGHRKIAEMESREKEKIGVSTLKIRYNRVFGYFIEIPNTSKHRAPEQYIRRQTLTNCERYITEELKELEEGLLNAESKIYALESRLFEELHQKLKVFLPRFLKSASIIADCDALFSLARVSTENRYTCPEVCEDASTSLYIKAGRHPVIEVIQQEESPFVPNDLEMQPGKRFIHLITGPNMGGKSTFMRQSALIVLMAHIGCFVPAQKARMPLFERIFTRVGASDNLTKGQSTFMVEMNETASIINQLTPRSLVILDEIGRGTGTYDGMALARAIAEYLHEKQTLTLFATHYHELANLEKSLPGLQNFQIMVQERDGAIIFLKKVMPGIAGKSYGIQVAEMAGLPAKLTQRAKTLLEAMETADALPRAEKKTSPGKPAVLPLRQNHTDASRDAAHAEQLDFFNSFEHPVIEKIKQTDVNVLSPIEALNILHKFKEELTA